MTVRKMMRGWSVVCVAGAAGLLCAAVASGADPAPAAPKGDQISYSIGYDLGADTAKGLKADGVEVNPDMVAKGLADGLRGAGTMLTAEQVDAVLVSLHKELASKRVKARLASDPVFKAFAEENAKKSAEFHANFAKKQGVTTLPSGCQYSVVRKGEGASAKDAKSVVVTFRAVLITGREFGRGENAEVQVATLNEGAQELIRLMHEGDKWQVAIPPSRAFGDIGRDPDVGPNETIVADVELVKVK